MHLAGACSPDPSFFHRVTQINDGMAGGCLTSKDPPDMSAAFHHVGKYIVKSLQNIVATTTLKL